MPRLHPPKHCGPSRWSQEVERFLSTHRKPYGEPVEPRPSKCTWIGTFGERPPAYAPSLFSRTAPENTARIVAALRGADAAQAIWFVETLRRSPDEALDGLLGLLESAEPTKVYHFHCKYDSVGDGRGFPLGTLVKLLVSERTLDPVLYYNTRRAVGVDWLNTPELAAKIEAAWKARRTKG